MAKGVEDVADRDTQGYVFDELMLDDGSEEDGCEREFPGRIGREEPGRYKLCKRV